MERRLSTNRSKTKKTFYSISNRYTIFSASFSSFTHSQAEPLPAVCLWINASSFLLTATRCEFSTRNETKKQTTQHNKYMKNQRKTNGLGGGKKWTRVECFRSVVVLAIKYTANNNKSDTWQEKYNVIITEILHFCLSCWGVDGVRAGGVRVWVEGIIQTRRA